MKRKFLVVLMAIAATLCMAFGLSGCGEPGKDGKDGLGIQSLDIDENGHLIVTLSDGTVKDLGKITAENETPSVEGTEGLQYQKRKDEAGNEYAAVVGLGMAWETEIVIPSAYRDLPVKEIEESAFSASTDARNGALTSISIPDSVTSIGERAFSGCSGLTSVKIGNGVASIGSSAFWNCSGLTSIEIPDSVTSIGYDAFYGCSELTSVTIGSGVTSIGDYAFWGCSGLEEFLVDTDNINYSSQDGILYDKTKAQIIFVPVAIKGAVTIPESMTSIGEGAFAGCSGLTSIDIPDSVISIGKRAFSSCSGLAEIKVDPNNQTYHGKDNCLIETKSKTLILGCKTSEIPDDGSVTSIGYDAFYGCSGLTSIDIPDSVASIGVGAFYGCSGLTSIDIPDSVASIGVGAFEGCSKLKEVHFENPNGWKVWRAYEDASQAKDISGLDDPATAAIWLSINYCDYYWKRG